MPTLEWIGKNKVVNHHQEVPFRVLERQYSFDEQGQHTENNGSENMIIRFHFFFFCFCHCLFSSLQFVAIVFDTLTRNRRNCDDNNGHNAGCCCCNTRVHAVCTNLTAEQGLVGIHHRSIGAYTAENLCQGEEAHRFGSPQHQRSAKNALNQREGDVEEFVKNICTLNSGGFIVIGRDFFNSCNVHQHEVAHIAEYISDAH